MIAESGFVRRTYGGVDVTVLVDGIWSTSKETIVHLNGAASRQQAIDHIASPTLSAPVNCFLVSGTPSPLLIDAGAGTDWGEHYGRARTGLASLGVAPAEVAHVLLTHIHLDHAAGLFDGDSRYFPNAVILAPSADLAYFTDQDAQEATPPAKRGGFELTERLLRVYGDQVRPIDAGVVLPEIEMMPLPGHTPGHAGFILGSGTDRVMTLGDIFHFADLQAGDPDIGVPYDTASNLAAQSRRRALETASTNGWHICGGHLDGFRGVSKTPTGYALHPIAGAT